MLSQPECPECEKLLAISPDSNKIGDFLDWLDSNDITLCKYHSQVKTWNDEHTDYYIDPAGYYPVRANFEKLLAEYFKIDLDKVEAERKSLLDWIRQGSMK